MNKEFIPEEQALALKELGFDEPCMAQWNDSNGFDGFGGNYRNSYFTYPDQVAAPTFSQAFRWFRDKYDLDIDISRNDQEMIDYVERKGEKYLPKYRYGYSNGIFIPIGTCMKYEEADLACLKKLIEIIKQKNDNNT
jgi:hypothetical protein